MQMCICHQLLFITTIFLHQLFFYNHIFAITAFRIAMNIVYIICGREFVQIMLFKGLPLQSFLVSQCKLESHVSVCCGYVGCQVFVQNVHVTGAVQGSCSYCHHHSQGGSSSWQLPQCP